MKYPLFNSNAWIGLQEVPGRVQRHEIKLEIKMRGKHGGGTSEYLCLFFCGCVCACQAAGLVVPPALMWADVCGKLPRKESSLM